jgi:hypothetical protein
MTASRSPDGSGPSNGLGAFGDARCIEGRQGLKLIGDLKQDVLGFRVGRFVGESARLVRTQTKTRVRVRHCVGLCILSPFSRTTCLQSNL